jgi:WD40 repeat protein
MPSRKAVAVLKRKGRYPEQLAFEALSFSPDAKRLAASSLSNEVFVWDIASGEQVAAIQEGQGSGWTEGRCWIGFAPDGTSLCTASRGMQDLSKLYARRRDAATGKLIRQIELSQPGEPFPYTYPRIFAPDGKLLVGVGEFTTSYSKCCVESILVLYDIAQL